MKPERNIVIAAVVACAVPLALWLWVFWTPSLSDNHAEWSEFGSFLGGVLSPTLAFTSFLGLLATIREQREVAKAHKQQADDLNYFNHASASLERAYETLTRSSTETVPAADRLAWLSCARLLLSAEEVAKRISDKSEGLRALYEGEREHWRRKFYELFHPKGGISVMQVHIQVARLFSPVLQVKALVFLFLQVWLDTRALQLLNATSPSMMM